MNVEDAIALQKQILKGRQVLINGEKVRNIYMCYATDGEDNLLLAEVPLHSVEVRGLVVEVIPEWWTEK